MTHEQKLASAGGDSNPARTAGRALRLGLGIVIAGAFIGGLEAYLGWAVLLRPWTEVPVTMVIAPAALLVLTHAMRAMRLHDYFGSPVHHRRLACFRLVLKHTMANNLLPMRLGEVAFPVLMARRFGVLWGDSLPGLLWFRLLDLHSVIGFALGVFAWAGDRWEVAGAALIWLGLPYGVARKRRRMHCAVAHWMPSWLALPLERALNGIPATARVFWWTWAWTLSTWGLKLAIFAWILGLFAPVKLSTGLLGAIGGELTSVLPVHGVAGLGTYEAGVLGGVVTSGVDTKLLITAAVNLHLFMLGISIVAGAIAWLPMPARGNELDHDGES